MALDRYKAAEIVAREAKVKADSASVLLALTSVVAIDNHSSSEKYEILKGINQNGILDR